MSSSIMRDQVQSIVQRVCASQATFDQSQLTGQCALLPTIVTKPQYSLFHRHGKINEVDTYFAQHSAAASACVNVRDLSRSWDERRRGGGVRRIGPL